MIITEILTKNAEKYGNEIALIEREPAANKRLEMTWKQFDADANRLANVLFSWGIRKGDKVALLMTNCIEWLPIYFGILRLGAWAVPLNFRYTEAQLKQCNETAEVKSIIFGEEFIDRIHAIKSTLDRTVTEYVFVGRKRDCPDYAHSYPDLLTLGSDKKPNVAIDLSDEAALYFTSGTTGNAKAVLLTHKNLAAACDVENSHHYLTHDDNFLCLPPLYHTGAKMHWFGNFLVGAKCVILKGVRPEWVLEAISEEGITVVFLLVPWAHDILIALESDQVNLNNYKLAQWRLMHMGAQAIPPSLVKQWKNIFPDQQYDVNYGLTESSGPGCVHLGIENSHKVGAIGLPGDGWECKVIDDHHNPLPYGEKGELIVKGPGVMREYYRNPEATATALVEGWLHTGDVACIDSEGFIHLVDRKKDVIIAGGENIYPVELENYFSTLDKIRDVAVIGIPDERLGEVVAAVIEVKPGSTLTQEEVAQFSSQLPRYQRPRKIFFGEVPRNPTGKIEKPQLREKYR